MFCPAHFRLVPGPNGWLIKPIPAPNPDCVTRTQVGNTLLIVSGYFNPGASETAIDKMQRVLEDEAAARPLLPA